MKKNTRSYTNATLDDVARYAKVSTATVSRFINKTAAVSERNRQKIEEAIKALNYVPHAAARALASNRSRMIGVIVPSLNDNLFSNFLDSFQNLVTSEGYTIVVASDDNAREKEFREIHEMVSHGVDALVLVGMWRDKSLYSLLQEKNIPYVVTWAVNSGNEPACIGFDNQQAAAKIANYLMDLGHERIAMISGLTKQNDRAYNRLIGVRAALAERQLSLPDEWVIERPFGIEQGQEAFRTLMTGPQRPTAIICGADPFAYGAVFESKILGVDIPGDVSVTGFDDTWLAQHLTPALTTLRTPQTKMARLTAQYLISRLRGDEVDPPQMLDVELIVRDSCAPPDA